MTAEPRTDIVVRPVRDVDAEALGRMHAEGPFPDRRRAPRVAEPLPDVPAQPESAIDITGVQIGNRDLECVPEWKLPTTPQERALALVPGARSRFGERRGRLGVPPAAGTRYRSVLPACAIEKRI